MGLQDSQFSSQGLSVKTPSSISDVRRPPLNGVIWGATRLPSLVTKDNEFPNALDEILVMVHAKMLISNVLVKCSRLSVIA